MKILASTDDHLDIDFHYCPLVAAWQSHGATDEKVASSVILRYWVTGALPVHLAASCNWERPLLKDIVNVKSDSRDHHKLA